jgi:hypothetical protein
VDVVTVLVLTAKVAELEPDGTVTEAGMVIAELFELESISETAAPPEPAAAVRLTVPVPDWPPIIVLGLTETLLRAPGSGSTVRPNVALTPE